MSRTPAGLATVRLSLAGAAPLGLLALVPAPEAKAACLPSNSICTSFDPTSPSSPTGISGFSGSISGVSPALNQGYITFIIAGYTGTGFRISGISLTGNGNPVLISNFIDIDDGNTEYYADFSSAGLASLNFGSSAISFAIPSGLNPGTTITANINYNSGWPYFNSLTSNNFSTTAVAPSPAAAPVPGPLPLLGAGAAFHWSRRLRQRRRRLPPLRCSSGSRPVLPVPALDDGAAAPPVMGARATPIPSS